MKKNLPFRGWFYFRTGYSQYFAFILALFNMLTLTYYLAISENQNLEIIFPSFLSYLIISSLIGVPLLLLVGYVHLRKSLAYSTEQEVVAEAYPYNFKLPPGIYKECYAPVFLELLKLGRKSLLEQKISVEELKKLEDLEKKLQIIVSGGSLPRPKKFDEIK